MTEDKKPLAPEVRALIDDISQRFRVALSWLGQEKPPPSRENLKLTEEAHATREGIKEK